MVNLENAKFIGEDLTNHRPQYQVDSKFTARMYTEQEVRDAVLSALTYSPNYQEGAARNIDIAERVIKSLG
jgi:hypothetical protein